MTYHGYRRTQEEQDLKTLALVFAGGLFLYLILRSDIMAVKLDSSGAIVPDTTIVPLTAMTGAAIAARDAIYIKDSDKKMYPCDGTEAAILNFAGFADAAYAMGVTGTYYPPGLQMGGFSGLVAGDQYITGSTIGQYSAVTVGMYTRRAATAYSATQIIIVVGEVKLKS